MSPRVPVLLALTASLALTAGCAGEGGVDDGSATCTGAKCDDLDLPDSEIPDSPCDGILNDRSGRGRQKVAGRLHDPVADKLFKTGDGCPNTFQDVLAKLRETDTQGCDPATPGAGMVTRAISETAQLAGAPTDYRLVVSRNCDGRRGHEMMFSIFGVAAGDPELPTNVELIGFDEEAGVFNYYEALPDGELNFFGNSKDFLKGVGSGTDRRCAGCHVGGGLVMKELEAPWVHWEGDTVTPGVAEVMAAHPELGRKSNGVELESTVRFGNAPWNETRLAALREVGDTRAILEPLFCDREINIHSGGPSQLRQVPLDAFVGELLGGFVTLPIDNAAYKAAIAANGSQVGSTGKTDTFFEYAFVKKAALDLDYVGKLTSAGIVDDALVQAISMVDFTRSVFSDDRCGLLDAVPSIPASELDAASLREGLRAAVASAPAGSPEAELARNLDSSPDEMQARLTAYLDACESRNGSDAAGFLADVLAVTSLNRDLARDLPGPIMEFPETMPDDDLDVAVGTRLSPSSCQLITSFEPAP